MREEETQFQKEVDRVGNAFQGAAVDSELALVREDNYPLDSWLPNKSFLGYHNKEIPDMPQNALMLSRLDEPSEKIIRRMMDDNLITEKEGLKGKACFDASKPDPGDGEVASYAFYDRAIHRAAWLLERTSRINR